MGGVNCYWSKFDENLDISRPKGVRVGHRNGPPPKGGTQSMFSEIIASKGDESPFDQDTVALIANSNGVTLTGWSLDKGFGMEINIPWHVFDEVMVTVRRDL